MKVVTTDKMRELDRRTIAEFSVPGETLMDRAGTGVADVVIHLARLSGLADPDVVLFAGRGNNGGDAFVAARVLKERGVPCEVWLAGETRAIAGDALTHLNKMKSAGVALRQLPTKDEWDALAEERYCPASIVVDAILGTGITGPARGPAAGAISYVNSCVDTGLVIAVDTPSGLDTDTGIAAGDAVVADITVTMGLPKLGLLQPCAVHFVGTIEVIDIGIPHELTDDISTELELVTPCDVRELVPRRHRNSHKGTFGHALLIGGSAGYAGAITLAARSAARSGAGLVTVLTPAGIATVVVGSVSEAMVHAMPETSTGSLSADCVTHWQRDINDFDAILIGPGMSTHSNSARLVEQVITECRVPLVIDADALNVCAGKMDLIGQATAPVIITPHPGEMGRLAGVDTAAIQANRLKHASDAVDKVGGVVVLKGAGTVIAAPGRPPNINMTGNPGMATGGMGDVLAGLITGLAAQGLAPFAAACTGTHLHGRAADYVAWRTSQAGMIASDVIEEIPSAFREISLR